MPRRRTAAPAPVEEDVFEEIDELEDPEEEGTEDDIEELDEEAPAPVAKKRGRPAKAAAPAAKKDPETDQFDSNWLAAYVTEETGIEYDARSIRMLLRRLAKQGHLAREVGTDRTRYVFPKGVNDPTVRAVLRMVKNGEAAAVKSEGLDAVKARRTTKPAPEPTPAPRKTAAKKAAAPAAKATATTRRRRAAPAE